VGLCQLSLIAPMVRFLRERLEKAGCAVGDNFFKAITCNQEVAGSYVRGEGVGYFYFLVHLLLLFVFSFKLIVIVLLMEIVLTMFNLLLCWKVWIMVLHVQLKSWLSFCLMKKISSQFYYSFVVLLVELVLWSMLYLVWWLVLQLASIHFLLCWCAFLPGKTVQ